MLIHNILSNLSDEILCLSSGVEIQKLSIINNLTRLLEKSSADVNRRVVPVLRVSDIYREKSRESTKLTCI